MASELTTDQLLAEMATVLQWNRESPWQARRRGSVVFHSGATAREAMERAMGLSNEQPPPDRRRRSTF